MSQFVIGMTDHLEGPAHRPSAEVFAEVAELVQRADQLGARYAWFTEHHAHVHQGHLPAPLLFALHLAARTRHIALGTAIICLNHYQPLSVAEQVAVADTLAEGRLAPGFGSGSTPEEIRLMNLAEMDDETRHARFDEALRVILTAWRGQKEGFRGRYFDVPAHHFLPASRTDLATRSWVAVNSAGSARIAGTLNFNMLFSHLRTPEQYREYTAVYRAAGGRRLIAANRPVFVGPDDASAFALAEPTLRTLWRRFRDEGKIPAATSEPVELADLCKHPINFIVGGPASVARQLRELHEYAPFDVANVELRWAGLPHQIVMDSLQRLMTTTAEICNVL